MQVEKGDHRTGKTGNRRNREEIAEKIKNDFPN